MLKNDPAMAQRIMDHGPYSPEENPYAEGIRKQLLKIREQQGAGAE
jgi:hypothetical protein